MQARYCILLTFDELSKLSLSTKNELAQLDPEFASICGIATAANPPEPPSNPRPTVQQGTTTVVLPERNQVNQQNSPAYNAAMHGQIPGMPPGVSPAPVVPSAMPVHTGVPQSPQQPQAQVLPPMQMPGAPPQYTEQPPFNAAPPLQGSPAAPAPQMPGPQMPVTHLAPAHVQQQPPQAQPAHTQPPVFAPGPNYDVNAVKSQIVGQVMAERGGEFILGVLNEAKSIGFLSRPHLDALEQSQVPNFLGLLAARSGKVF